jgi:hypothetical protein
VRNRLNFVAIAICGALLILGIELAANVVYHRLNHEPSSSASGFEKQQAMPDWWERMYSWILSAMGSFPGEGSGYGGGGGGGW